MATAVITREDFVNAVAAEMAAGVEAAVEWWMAQIEEAFQDTRLTTLGKMHAIQGILDRYKHLSGKEKLQYCRRQAACR